MKGELALCPGFLTALLHHNKALVNWNFNVNDVITACVKCRVVWIIDTQEHCKKKKVEAEETV